MKYGRKNRSQSAIRRKTSPAAFYNFQTVVDQDTVDSYYDEKDPDLAVFRR
jgi:hypothetical protein